MIRLATAAVLLVVLTACGSEGDTGAEGLPAAVQEASVDMSQGGDGPIDGADGQALATPVPPGKAEALKAAAQRFYDALTAVDMATVRDYFPPGRCDLMRDLMAEVASDREYMAGAVWTVKEVAVDGDLGLITSAEMSTPGGSGPSPVDPEYVFSFAYVDGRWMWNCEQGE